MKTTARIATITLLAVLASVLAGCGYSTYLVSSQVNEGFMLAETPKLAVEAFHNANANWPRDNAEVGLPPAASITGRYVSSVDVGVHPGSVVVTYGTQAAAPVIRGKVAVLTATAQNGAVSWRCDLSLTTIPARYLPKKCRQ